MWALRFLSSLSLSSCTWQGAASLRRGQQNAGEQGAPLRLSTHSYTLRASILCLIALSGQVTDGAPDAAFPVGGGVKQRALDVGDGAGHHGLVVLDLHRECLVWVHLRKRKHAAVMTTPRLSALQAPENEEMKREDKGNGK